MAVRLRIRRRFAPNCFQGGIRVRTLSGLVLCALGLLVQQAKADLVFVGSQVGLNAFNVTLHQVSTTDVHVTVALTQGALWFANTGSGNHPGFAFNIAGDPLISIGNISAPWNALEFHITPVTTNGPGMGTFMYFADNPGNGTNASNAGPLSFDVILGSGITINEFTKNADGYYFAADIANAFGATGESGISAAAIATMPEPSSILLLLISVAGVGLVGKKHPVSSAMCSAARRF